MFDELHLSPQSTEQVRSRLDQAWRALGRADVLLVSTAGGGSWLGRLPEDEESLQAALLRFKGMRMPEASGKLTDYESFLIAARHDEPVLVQVYRRYIEAGLIRPDAGAGRRRPRLLRAGAGRPARRARSPAHGRPGRADLALRAGALPVRLAGFVLGRGTRGGSVVRLVAEVDAAQVGASGTLDTTFQLVAQAQGGAQQAPRSRPAGAPCGWEQQFEVGPGAYQARLVVRERDGDKRIGSVRHALTVQPPNAFRMTTPILTDVLVPPDQAPLARAERRFAMGATLHCLVDVMGGSGQPLQAGIEVQSANGTPVRQIANTPIASVPPSRRWSIPLARLEAGTYQLVISVKDDGKGQALTRREPFEIFGPSGSAD